MIKPIEFIFIATIFASTAILAAGSATTSNDTMFQTSTINALMQGVYDGNTTFKELRNYGDFGLGTVQALDGEMIEPSVSVPIANGTNPATVAAVDPADEPLDPLFKFHGFFVLPPYQ